MNAHLRSLRHAVSMIDLLESRRLLSTINWTNKGTGAGAGDTDDFNAIYGANATLARSIVQRAIDDWEEVIVNFNGSGGRNTFSLTLSAAAFSGGLRGQTGSMVYDALDKPQSATIELDDNGGGSGWYFDPTPGSSAIPDDGEFTTLVTPFDADAPGLTGFDFYRTTLHELGHAMGLASSAPRITSVEVNAGVDPVNPAASLRTVTTGGITYTLTTDGGRHFFEGGGAYAGPTHPNELMNAGRAVPSGTRRLISNVNAVFLRDLYNYTVTLPSNINSFWANLNRTSNVLTVSGDINLSGSDNDVFIIDVVGSDLRVRVGGTTELIPTAEFTSLVINAGNGDDIVYIDALPSGKGVTVNGGANDDLIVFSDLVADLDSGILSDVSVAGGTGNDSIRGDDINDGPGSDSYTFNSTSFTKNTFVATVNADIELVTINGSGQASTYNINGSSYNLLINGGGANDTLNVGGGDVDTNIGGLITLNGGGGSDRMVFNDASDGSGGDTVTFAIGSLNKGGQVITYNTMEAIVWTGSAQDTVYTMNAHAAGIPVTINGGSGNESFVLGNGDLDSNIGSNVTINGGLGTDSVNFSDSLDGAGGNTYTLTSTQLNKGGRLFNYSGFERVTISGSVTPAVYNINGSSGAETIVNGGNDADTFNVGGGDVDTNLGANITVNGGGGVDSLTIDDTADGSGADTATLTAGTIVKGGQTFVYSSMASLIWNGSALATTYNVNGTVPGTPVTINGGAANDTINVGGGDFDTNINGEVRTIGGGGTDRLVIDDSLDDGSVLDTYTLSGGTFTKSSAAGIDINFSSLILFGAPTMEQVVLNASNFDSIINVTSTGGSSLAIPPATPTIYPVPTTINGSGGADRINVAAGNIGTIRGNISVIGGAGSDQVTLDNSSSSASGETTNITHSVITNTAWTYAMLFDATTDILTFESGSGADTINHNATAVGPASVFINGNNGVDTFNMVAGVASVRGGAGLDTVVVNSDNVGTAGADFVTTEDLATLDVRTGGTVRVTGGGSSVIAVNTASIAGSIDLNDNAFIDRAGALPATYDTLLKIGFAGGTWTGGQPSIRSSVAATAVKTKDTLGMNLASAAFAIAGTPVNIGDLAIRYTQNGDADLDQDVDFNDLLRLAKNYNGTGKYWYEGNFTWDLAGDVNFNDLLQLAKNYLQPLLAGDREVSAQQASRLLPGADTPARSILGSQEEDVILA